MITAGLWHISITGEAVRATFSGSSAGGNDDDDEEETQVMLLDSCLLASDIARAGVLVLGPRAATRARAACFITSHGMLIGQPLPRATSASTPSSKTCSPFWTTAPAEPCCTTIPQVQGSGLEADPGRLGRV